MAGTVPAVLDRHRDALATEHARGRHERRQPEQTEHRIVVVKASDTATEDEVSAAAEASMAQFAPGSPINGVD
ncbi:MAG TPA: hypothetical protein VFT31_16845 [Kribbella sp.]|nr:hypothetical protein [Kribbella sp.]